MPKRNLADCILDEILTLRRPSSMLLEFDEGQNQQHRQNVKSGQDRVLSETLPPAAARRQLIVE
jgi:hypothetical protein